MNINTVDLNLFLVFRAIYMTQSVTQAGDMLNMTQSAVSNALKRLRDRFEDPLFIRAQSGMVPTPMADELIDLIEEGLRKFTDAIDKAHRFDPKQSDRCFRLATTDIGQLLLMPGLVRATRGLAPSIRFETTGAFSAEDARDLLMEGKIDVVVGNWAEMGKGFRHEKLCDDSFVVLLSRDHEIQSEQLTTEQYLAADHLSYRPSGGSGTTFQVPSIAHGLLVRRKIVLITAYSHGLEHIVGSSNLLLTIPSRLARSLAEARSDLRIACLPFQVDPIVVLLQWHERFDGDSGNRWLREHVMAAFSQLPAMLP